MFLCENVALLQRNLVTVSVQHDSYCKIRTINISGYGTIHHEIIDKIDIKEPYLKNSSGKLEIVLDVEFNVNDSLYSKIVAGTNRLSKSTYSEV